MSTQVVLADDHGVVLDGLRRLLEAESDIEVVGEADNGRRAVELAARLQPDVVVLDISMPQLNGIAAIQQIREQAPNTRVLALTMHTSGQVVSDMLRCGARGYVVKSSRIDEVIQAIRTVMDGRVYLSPEITTCVVQGLLGNGGEGGAAPLSVLSDREKEILQLVAEGQTTREIAKGLHLSTKTIETHRRSIMSKLDLHNVAELTRYAIREGLSPLDA